VVRLADLPGYTGLRRTQIDALIARGEFPRPVKLSARRKAWLEAELIYWQQQRIAARDKAEEATTMTERDTDQGSSRSNSRPTVYPNRLCRRLGFTK
jgi:prophage regulatory protein